MRVKTGGGKSALAAVVLSALLALGGCDHAAIQNTSGKAYLDGYANDQRASAAKGTEIDKAVRQAADVEPILRFPARFGLARISQSRLGPIPADEGEAWAVALAATGGKYGEFVPISPLVAAFAKSEFANRPTQSPTERVVEEIRLGAARQHVDAVMVYEVSSRSGDKGGVLSVMDLTLIGAFIVPSRTLSGSAVAQGVLLDVRNGYPYLTVQASAAREGLHTSMGSGAAARELGSEASTEAVKKLIEKLPPLFDELAVKRKQKVTL